jgi:hypothetical protein
MFGRTEVAVSFDPVLGITPRKAQQFHVMHEVGHLEWRKTALPTAKEFARPTDR